MKKIILGTLLAILSSSALASETVQTGGDGNAFATRFITFYLVSTQVSGVSSVSTFTGGGYRQVILAAMKSDAADFLGQPNQKPSPLLAQAIAFISQEEKNQKSPEEIAMDILTAEDKLD